jgi:curli biogenesis system outer membrane secretion channel CsgG
LTRHSTSSESVEGEIKSWRKLSSRRTKEGLYKVKVSASIYRYQHDESTKRKRIAVVSLSSHKAAGKDLSNKIESYLVQSRKFSVLSRSHVDEILDEHNFLQTMGVSLEERARVGNLLGADLLLLVNLEKIHQKNRTDKLSLTGQTFKHTDSLAEMNLKVISTSSGEIKFYQTYSMGGEDKFSSVSELINQLAERASTDLVQRIYPNRIVKITNGSVFINIGGESINKGDLYDVYAEGDAIIDPYTGESLGKSEIYASRIIIDRVQSKFSVAHVIEGQEIFEGMIIRPSEVKGSILHERIDRVPDSEPGGPSKGFKLPFD